MGGTFDKTGKINFRVGRLFESRNDVVEIGDVLNAALLDLIPAKHSGGSGIILKVLLAPIGGDDDDVPILRGLAHCGRIDRLSLRRLRRSLRRQGADGGSKGQSYSQIAHRLRSLPVPVFR